jgi:hypothetical protein
VFRGEMEQAMKRKILLTAIALMSSAVAAPALASGDVSADRYWTRQAQQTTSRSAPGASRETGTPASTIEARKADSMKCACAMMSGAHGHMGH